LYDVDVSGMCIIPTYTIYNASVIVYIQFDDQGRRRRRRRRVMASNFSTPITHT